MSCLFVVVAVVSIIYLFFYFIFWRKGVGGSSFSAEFSLLVVMSSLSLSRLKTKTNIYCVFILCTEFIFVLCRKGSL